jgi:hypothetical protein
MVGYRSTPSQVLPVFEHWNGASWANDSPTTTTNGLQPTGVDSISPTDAWAVGLGGEAWHWNGASWTRNDPLFLGTLTSFSGVYEAASNDVWAAGETYDSGTGVQGPLVEHWNGASWSVSPIIQQSGLIHLTAIGALSSSDIWVGGVGDQYSPTPYFQHWNGTTWTAYLAPTAPIIELTGIDPISTNDVWAVGWGGNFQGAVFHWNGSSWSKVAVPTALSGFTYSGVTSTGANDIWVAASGGVAIHWNGQTWQQVAAPTLNLAAGGLVAIIGFPSHSSLIAAGPSPTKTSKPLLEHLCENVVTQTSMTPTTAAVPIGGTTAWAFRQPSGNVALSDASALALFSAPNMAPGSSFLYAYAASGLYTATNGSQTEAMNVPVESNYKSGALDWTFTLTWAVPALPAGTVEDVQILRPGTTTWKAWQSGTTNVRGLFTPDAGVGTYEFRARLRVSSGGSSGWSGPVSINVHN